VLDIHLNLESINFLFFLSFLFMGIQKEYSEKIYSEEQLYYRVIEYVYFPQISSFKISFLEMPTLTMINVLIK
jgi:hypothetical protein